MKRRSVHDHLKHKALKLYNQGVGTRQIAIKLGVPKSTVHDWLKEFREAATPVDVEVLESNPDTNRTPDNSPLSTGQHHLKVIHGNFAEVSEYAIAKRTLVDIAESDSQPGAVRVQAALGLMRLIALRAEIPKEILEGREQGDRAAERRSLEGLSLEELAREYKRELDATYGNTSYRK